MQGIEMSSFCHNLQFTGIEKRLTGKPTCGSEFFCAQVSSGKSCSLGNIFHNFELERDIFVLILDPRSF